MDPKKTTILFVDDEPMILQGLQRLLRSMRGEWDMTFINSGAEALDLMAKTPFDVVVSDMRMPGMNGAELLNEVMRRYPKTIRLILSGHADNELIVKCIGSTHQYLSKPCDAEVLKATLHRASTLESALKNTRIQQLASQMERLPSIPSVYSEIVEAAQNPDTSLTDIGAIITKDLGLTAQILKLVNSAFFGLRRQIASPDEALSYLGLEIVKTLVLSLHVFSDFKDVQDQAFSLQSLWQHSLSTASAAKAIASHEPVPPKMRDEAFVSGMLHDVGKIVLACNFVSQYGEAARIHREKKIAIADAEQEVFGVNHADIGGYLLGLWGLPVPIVETIALHHRPAISPNRTMSPLPIVHVANNIVHESGPESAAAYSSPLDIDYLKEMGVADRLNAWRDCVRQGADAP